MFTDMNEYKEEQRAAGLTRAAYTVEEVAIILGCHPKTVRKLCKEGRLAYVKLGPRCIRIPREALEAFLRGEKMAS